MKNKFWCPCLVRDNTPDLQVELQYLGYVPTESILVYGFDCLIVNHPMCLEDSNEPYYSGVDSWMIDHHPGVYEDVTDCGINNKLFLALAALRTDSDINQWFTDGINWVQSDIHDLLGLGKDYFEEVGMEYLKTHKARVKELIEHFNSKSHGSNKG